MANPTRGDKCRDGTKRGLVIDARGQAPAQSDLSTYQLGNGG